MDKLLINTADLKARIEANEPITAVARPINSEVTTGHLLHLSGEEKEWVLSTWRSDNPRLFKRSDALLTEAAKLGLRSVTFELAQED